MVIHWVYAKGAQTPPLFHTILVYYYFKRVQTPDFASLIKSSVAFIGVMKSTKSRPLKGVSQTKTFVITGGSSGIGLAIARGLVQSGPCELILVAKEASSLKQAEEALNAEAKASDQNVKISTIECDLTQMRQVRHTVEKIQAQAKSIYALVHNAGIYPFGSTADTSEKQWDEVMNIHLKVPFFLTQGLLNNLKSQTGGARILNISSTAGILPNHFAVAYSVSKGAMVHLTKTMAKELGKERITVNCICPGIVRSPLHIPSHRTKSELEEFYARRGAAFPVGRVGEPEDVANAALYFLSESAEWCTGEIMILDGGRLLI